MQRIPALAALRLSLLPLCLALACSSPAPKADGPKPANAEKCRSWVNRAALDDSLALGGAYMLKHQNATGSFNYQYDWSTQTFDPGDNSVRQAGSTWGLALIHREIPDHKPTSDGLDRALKFWEGRTHEKGGRHFPVYPSDRKGSLGTAALVALALIEKLQTDPGADKEALEARLNGILNTLVAAHRPEGLFKSNYSHKTGVARGNPSPYADGESLLALVSAARYLGRDDLRPLVLAEAEAGWQQNVVEPRAIEPDPNRTKGYYQWASMAWFELATSGWEGTEIWGDRLMELADWMVHTHRTLERSRNTAYAYEGIIPAWEIARQRGDKKRQAELACVIHEGLAKLTSWQVGHPMAVKFMASAANDPLAVGGVQNHKAEAPLRIDVVQHQMHAVIMAREFFLKE
jgi:hypothetical protein